MKSLTFESYEECKLTVHGLTDGDYSAIVELLELVEIGGILRQRKLVAEVEAFVRSISAKRVVEVCDRWHARPGYVIMALGAVVNRAQYWVEKAKAYEARKAAGAA
jgi:hypothetical protein